MVTNIDMIKELRRMLHDIPGYAQNEVLLLEGTFACASTGMEIKIQGSPAHAAKVRTVARSLGLSITIPKEPFRWSEDFGYYLQKSDGAFFGIGCGEEHAGLHTADYEQHSCGKLLFSFVFFL